MKSIYLQPMDGATIRVSELSSQQRSELLAHLIKRVTELVVVSNQQQTQLAEVSRKLDALSLAHTRVAFQIEGHLDQHDAEAEHHASRWNWLRWLVTGR